ncbi:Ig-like domain repeat protein [Nocardioides speluncae]|uniref:Ig-like domain repeat protein n=1 Tax=Nocardioides speluncae TaxID=2670337 RepID=UPI000D692464|nr:Ig-like domain repeat protein [Nocardioides speluncae]
MSARRFLAGVVAAAAASSLALVASPATADPSFTPVEADVVGVGSDTTQFVMNFLADGTGPTQGWNDTHATGRLASFDAIGGSATVVLKEGSAPITRPNGSTAGKNLLHGAGNNADVDYARSSSALSAAEVSAGLQAFPFAVDGMRMAVKATGSNAPAAITSAQLLGIYKGEITNWSEIGGTAGVIKPYVPQTGSGTRAFFLAQLKALNGGTDPVLAPHVGETQEHSDADIKDNPNAVAPYSTGRAKTTPTIKLLADWSAARALYNVVRGADVNRADLTAVFGSAGFVCSTGARPLIEAAGFDQLATPANGGVCGEPTQVATTNFTTNAQLATTTALAGSSLKAGNARLVATVATDSVIPEGTVQFLEGAVVKATGAVVQGKATVDVNGLTAGNHTFTAKYLPEAGSNFDPSTSAAKTVLVKKASTTTVSFSPSAPAYGKAAKVLVSVTASGSTPTGSVSIKVGTAAAKTVTLVSGKASLTLSSSLKAGSHTVSVKYNGSTSIASSTSTKTLKIAKAKPALTESFPSTVLAGKLAKGTVKVAISGSTVKPTGKVVIKRGTTVLKTITLVSGQATVTLPKLPKGTITLTLNYSGSSNVLAGKKSFTIIQK